MDNNTKVVNTYENNYDYDNIHFDIDLNVDIHNVYKMPFVIIGDLLNLIVRIIANKLDIFL